MALEFPNKKGLSQPAKPTLARFSVHAARALQRQLHVGEAPPALRGARPALRGAFVSPRLGLWGTALSHE